MKFEEHALVADKKECLGQGVIHCPLQVTLQEYRLPKSIKPNIEFEMSPCVNCHVCDLSFVYKLQLTILQTFQKLC